MIAVLQFIRDRLETMITCLLQEILAIDMTLSDDIIRQLGDMDTR
jgi:hypothetical protein